MKRGRKEILTDLISLLDDVEILQHELINFSWDIEEPLVLFQKSNLIKVLNKFFSSEINLAVLEKWANAIECREDIEFENDDLQEIISEIANPTLYEITSEKLLNYLQKYE